MTGIQTLRESLLTAAFPCLHFTRQAVATPTTVDLGKDPVLTVVCVGCGDYVQVSHLSFEKERLQRRKAGKDDHDQWLRERVVGALGDAKELEASAP